MGREPIASSGRSSRRPPTSLTMCQAVWLLCSSQSWQSSEPFAIGKSSNERCRFEDWLEMRQKPQESVVHFYSRWLGAAQDAGRQATDFMRDGEATAKLFVARLRPQLKESLESARMAALDRQNLLKESALDSADEKAGRASSTFSVSASDGASDKRGARQPCSKCGKRNHVTEACYFCTHCKAHGHKDASCFKLHPELKKTKKHKAFHDKAAPRQHRSDPHRDSAPAEPVLAAGIAEMTSLLKMLVENSKSRHHKRARDGTAAVVDATDTVHNVDPGSSKRQKSEPDKRQAEEEVDESMTVQALYESVHNISDVPGTNRAKKGSGRS